MEIFALKKLILLVFPAKQANIKGIQNKSAFHRYPLKKSTIIKIFLEQN